jgi:excisionase family DNA binding protein
MAVIRVVQDALRRPSFDQREKNRPGNPANNRSEKCFVRGFSLARTAVTIAAQCPTASGADMRKVRKSTKQSQRQKSAVALTDAERFLTVPEVADLLAMSPRHVWREIKNTELKKTPFGRATRVSKNDLADYVRRKKRQDRKKARKIKRCQKPQ